MGVQEKIFRHIEEHSQEEFTAQIISELFMISRNAASHHLNRLVDEGKLAKTDTRPTLFFLAPTVKLQPFENVVGAEGSLKTVIAKCKAAVNYPKGLPVLLHGKSGTGKSFLAKEIWRYAKQTNVIASNAPFVILNCADYANNPELLSSTLFGYVKGAFTGADNDKKGLLMEADGGFLFLDEVHNLSAENQEKLFLFIDSGRFRQLGDNENWQSSTARLIMATTEDVETTFQATFVRRIPFLLSLPEYTKRPRQERRQLIDTFFRLECQQVDRDIIVSKMLIQNYIGEEYHGNIGQLKNEIKVMVAENILKNHETIKIPQSIESQQAIHYSKEFQPLTESIPFDETEVAKFKTIKSYTDLCNALEHLLFFVKYTIMNQFGDFTTFLEIAEKNFLDLPFEKIKKICRQHGLPLSDGDRQDLTLLLLFLYYNGMIFPFQIHLNHSEQLNSFKELSLAKKICKKITADHKELDQIQLIVAAFLQEKIQATGRIPAIIVMHGENNATSIAYTVNELLAAYVLDGFDMSLQVKNEELILEIIEYIKQVDTSKGIIVLVDMGSLEEMYGKIASFVEGDLLLVNNVSTSLALDIGNKVKHRESMEKILAFNQTLFSVEKKYFEGFSQKPNILISCMSGEGIAVKVKEILQEYIDPAKVELLTMDYANINQRINKKDHQIFRNTLAILTTPGFKETELPVITIEGIVNGTEHLNGLVEYLSEEQQKECEKDIVKLFTIEGAGARLTFLNPEMVINEVSEVIKAYEDYYQIEIENFLRINLFLHLSSMIERILKQDAPDDDVPEIIEEDAEFKDFVAFSNVIFSRIRKKYNIQIPRYEYGLVFQLIKELAESK